MAKVEFDHISGNGTVFRCAKLDLSKPIKYSNRPKDNNMFLQDVAELISFHCFHVWEELNSFNGYESIKFVEEKEKKEKKNERRRN